MRRDPDRGDTGAVSTPRTRTRWLVPAAAVTTIVGGVAFSQAAGAAGALPERSAAQLLVDLQTSPATPVSGTVTDSIDLGLPALPGAGDGGASTDPMSLLTGEHTWRLWSDGAEKTRLALVAQASETNIVRNGDQVWQWSSKDRTATKMVLTGHDDAAAGAGATSTPEQLPRTPQEAADWALAKVDPTTAVTTAANTTVAGRDAYELVLTPKDTASRVASVRVAVDAQKKVPLRVQVFSTKASAPAINVGFSQVSFDQPADSVFAFTPPAGATIVDKSAGEKAKEPTDKPAAGTPAEPTIAGSGWTSVATGRLPSAPAEAPAADGRPAGGPRGDAAAQADPQAILSAFPTASGTWGSGHVLDGTLISAVVTDDGRYAVGAVAPSALYAALPAK